MPMTVPQLAKKLHLTSQAIQQRMRSIQDFIPTYTTKPHRSRIISDAGVNILVNHNSLKSKGHAERQHKTETDALIAQLRDDLKYSRHKEDQSSKQITALNEQIKDMTLTTNRLYSRFNTSQNNLRNEQVRLLNERNKSKLLKYKETTAHNNLLEYKKSHKVNSHGWIWRLFH